MNKRVIQSRIQLMFRIAVSGESFYHVLETVESSLVEPADESASTTPAIDDVSGTVVLAYTVCVCSV